VKEVKKSLDNFEFTVSNYILNAFKPKHSEGYISFQVLKNKLDLWTKNAGLLKDLKETAEEDHFDSMDGQGMDNISEADNEY
jgi:hypothetical protein